MAENFARNIEEITLEQLMIKTEQEKLANKRLAQIFAVYVNDKYEIFYCFVNCDAVDMITYKLVIDLDMEVPSIGSIYSGAVYYEIEMIQMFGVNVIGIDPKFGKRLYRIEADTPFGPEKKESEGEEDA